ncbi:SLC13 family permease [Rhizosaccharibacter radicis]|uniref:SLC13 family permease n=1 Tax=Rhizosaccharibacter radicis TaxID=2782605 RepID=A0ABT1VUA7_9PROT|nr:SLC13 family permease [Acetobacteraceae bacterium KSS12]
MTTDQALAFGIIGCTVALFVWGKLAYDLVAILALCAALLTGLVSPEHAFSGFSSEVVVIIAAALVISAAIGRSGIVENLMHPLLPHLRSVQAQVPVLVTAVGLLSMFCKNVGALAIFMPTAQQLARRGKRSPSNLLMPMSFAALLGGLSTLIGTAPNILIAQIREDLEGKPFGMFSFAPVGLVIGAVGITFLTFGYRLVPKNRKPAGGLDAAFTFAAYTAEAVLPSGSPLAEQTVAALERAGDHDVRAATIIRERFRRLLPTPDTVLKAGDVLLLEGEPEALERLISRGRLLLVDGGRAATLPAPAADVPAPAAHEDGEASVVEGIVTADSPLLNQTATGAHLTEKHGLGLIALSRSGEPLLRRLAAVRFRVGDIVVLRGPTSRVPDALGALRVLPLAERRITLGASHRSLLPLLVLVVAMVLAATHVLNPGVAFFVAAAAMILLRFLSMEEAYECIEWHVLVLLGALIPVSHAVQDTGGTKLIAHFLLGALQHVPPSAALAIILVLAMVITPFLHNAPTVLMLGPISGALAQQLHLNPDAFLMAVAIGAGCDFLTPIGHQCNTLVYAPGGYRFGDYWRLGLPLSVLVVVTAVPMIMLVWGLKGH